LSGVFPNKMVLFAYNQTFRPPNFLDPPKFLGWLRHCLRATIMPARMKANGNFSGTSVERFYSVRMKADLSYDEPE